MVFSLAFDWSRLQTRLSDSRYTTLSIRPEVFKEAIRSNSAGLIVAHNHPSGDPSPSAEDIAVTSTLVKAGKLLDIEVIDHVVVAQNRYVSLKERGLGFE